jgi:ketol-acid reductoisomerase
VKRMLKEIQDGDYARKWIDENEKGRPWFNSQRSKEQEHPIEEVGARLRELMQFLHPVRITPDGNVSKPAQSSETNRAQLANAGD